MQHSEANSLFSLLKEKINFEMPLYDQIREKFILSPLNQKIYSRDTWLGRVLTWLERPSSWETSTRKVYKKFQEAIQAVVQENPDNFKRLSRKKKVIFYEMAANSLSAKLPSKVKENPHIEKVAFEREKIEKEIATKEKRKKEQKISKSLLRQPLNRKFQLPNDKVFNALFGTQEEFQAAEIFDFFESYLKVFPEQAVQDWQSKLNLLRAAFYKDEKLTIGFTNSKDKSVELKETSLKFCQEIHHLQPNQKHILLLSYGPRHPTLEGFFEILRLLPIQAQQSLPEGLRKLLQSDKPLDPRAFALDLLHGLIEEIQKNSAVNEIKLPSLARMSALFSNEDRALPESLNLVLPEMVEIYLENVLKGGALGATSLFLKKGIPANILQWIGKNGEVFTNSPSGRPLVEKIEKVIAKALDEHLFSSLDKSLSNFLKLGQQMQEILPPILLEAVGIDAAFEKGPLALEFEKREDGTFNVSIFTLGHGAKQHPLNANTQSHYGVLRLTDIKPEKVSQAFLQSLLARHYESLWNPKATNKAVDLYRGPILSLGGKVAPNSPSDFYHAEHLNPTLWQFVQFFLFKAEAQETNTAFELQLKVLLHLCEPYLQNNRLEFDKDAPFSKIQKAVDVISKERNKLTHPRYAKKVEQIDATLYEIREALKAYHVQEEPVSEKMDFYLKKWGITGKALDEWRSTFRWALGDEVGQLADFIVDELKKSTIASTPPPKVSKSSEEEKPHHYGWLANSILNLYLELYYRATEIFLALTGLYYGGRYTAFAVPLGHRLLPFVLPPKILELYNSILDCIKRTVVQIFLKIFWNSLGLFQEGRELQNTLLQFKQRALRAKSVLEGDIPLNLELLPSLFPTPILRVPQKIEEKSALHTKKNATCEDATRMYKTPLLHHLLSDEFYVPEIELPRFLGVLLNLATNSYQPYVNSFLFEVLHRQLLRLHLPSHHEETAWDRIENPEIQIETLFKISQYLWDSYWNSYFYKTYGNVKTDRSHLIVSIYTIFAIIRCLSLRCEGVPKGQVNAFDLPNWYGSFGCIIREPQLNERIRKIGAYLLPEIDFDQIPESSILAKKAKDSFFGYSNSIPQGLNPPEKKYLESFLKDPLLDLKFMEGGYPLNLPDQKKVVLLFYEGFDNRFKIVPRPFNVLRMISLMAQKSTNPHQESGESIRAKLEMSTQQIWHTCFLENPTYVDVESSIFFPFPELSKIFGLKPKKINIHEGANQKSGCEDCWVRYESRSIMKINHLFTCHLNEAQKYLITDTEGSSLRRWSVPSFTKPRTQVEIMRAPLLSVYSWKENLLGYGPSKEVYKARPWILNLHKTHQEEAQYLIQDEFILCEPSERILMMLNFYKKHRRDLHSRTREEFMPMVLFAPRALQEFLGKTPHGVELLGEFFRDVLKDRRIHSTSTLSFWLLHVAAQCKMQMSREQANRFPLRNILEEFHQTVPLLKTEARLYWYLVAVSAMGDWEIMTVKEKEDLVRALCYSACLPKHSILEQVPDTYGALSLQAELDFWKWSPKIDEQLRDTQFREQLIEELLQIQQISLPKRGNEKWKEINFLAYARGEIQFSIGENKIRGMNLIRDRALFANEHPLTKAFDPNLRFREYENGSLLIQERNLEFRLTQVPGTSDYDFSLIYQVDQTPYSWTLASEKIWQQAIENLPTENIIPGYVLIELTDQPEKKMLVRKKESLFKTISIGSLKEEHPKNTRTESPIETDKILENLSPFRRFVRTDQINAHSSACGKYIEHLKFLPFNLEFTTEKDAQGHLRAMSQDFEGYYIAEKQKDPALKGLSSYLILENSTKKKKILIPTNQLAAAFLWRALKFTGPFASYLSQFLGTSRLAPESFFVNPDKKFGIYDILEKTPTQPFQVLDSQDPVDAVNILLLYLMQGDLERAEASCRSFEWICSNQPIPQTVWKQLIILTLAHPEASTDLDHLSLFRMRIFAAISQNQCVRGKQNSDMENGSMVQDLLIIASTLMDLRRILSHPKERSGLNPTQEYFLYQSVLQRIESILKKSFHLPERISKLMNLVGWDFIIEEMGILPGFSDRFDRVKKEANILVPQQYLKLLRWAFKTYCSQAHLPEIFNQALLVEHPNEILEPGAFDDEGGVVKKVGEWIASARDNCLFNLTALRLRELHGKVFPRIARKPILNPLEISSHLINKHFFTYYSIARGDWYFAKGEAVEKEMQAKLASILMLYKGGWDGSTRVLLILLEAVLAYPDHYPRTSELQKAYDEVHLNRSEKLEEKFKSWNDIFTRLNRTALPGSFFEKLFEPAVRYKVYASAAHRLTNQLKTVAVTLLPKSELWNFASQVASTALTDLARGELIRRTKTLWKKESAPGKTLLSKEGMDVSPALLDANLLFGLAAGAYGLYALNTAATEGLSAIVSHFPQMAKTAVGVSSFQTMLLTSTATVATKFLLAKVFKRRMTVRDIIPLPSVVVPAISAGYKMVKAYQEMPNTVFFPSNEEFVKQKVPPSYAILAEVDAIFNSLFERIFNELFIEKKEQKEWSQLAPFEPVTPLSPIHQERFQRVNDSLNAFYRFKEERPLIQFIYHGEGDLISLCFELKSFRNSLVKEVDDEQKALLAIFNPKNKKMKPVTYDALHVLVEKQHLGPLGKELKCNDDLLPSLELALARIDHKKSRLQQLERILESMEELLHQPVDSEKTFHLIERLGLELKNRTRFSFTETPPRLLRNFLKFQAGTNSLIWERQANSCIAVLKDPYASKVVVLLMGDGKTWFIIPTEASYLSSDRKLVVPVFPKQLAGDNMREVNTQLRQIFQKATHALQISREAPLNEHNLRSILLQLNGALKEGEAIQMTKEDALAIKMILRDKLYQFKHEKEKPSVGEIILLKQIRSLLRRYAVLLPDEAHETYARRHRLNYPEGADQIISPQRYRIIETCLMRILQDPELLPLIRANKLTKLDKKHYNRVIKPRLAHQLSRLKLLQIKGEEKRLELVAFLCDKASEIPVWIKVNKPLYEMVSLIKGTLEVLFPLNFKNRVDVNYGASEDSKNGEFARPSAGNSSVIDTDTIQLPYETLVKTALLFISRGLNKEQSYTLTKTLLEKVASQSLKLNVPFDQTPLYQIFKEIIPSQHFTRQYCELEQNSKEFEEIHSKICHHPTGCMLYIRYHVWKEIRYWNRYIEGNSQHFSAIGAREISCTGSPYNDGTYPARLEVMHDPTTIGEALHLISEKTPNSGIHLIANDKPEAILKNILHTHFNQGSRFGALIDGGALLTGMKHEQVARLMQAFCEQNRPDIQGIRFYKKDSSGKEKLYCLLKGTTDPIPANTCNIPKNLLIDYIDQVHGFGSNNCPAGDGLETIGPHHPLYKWLQEVFRMRGLKREQFLHSIGQKLVELPQQGIQFITTEEIHDSILEKLNISTPGYKATLRDLISYFILNEAEIAEEENYPAMRDKLAALIDQAIEDKILDVPDHNLKEILRLFDEFEQVLIQTLEDDPIKLFGLLKKKVNPRVALKDYSERLFEIIKKSSSFTQKEKERIWKELCNMAYPPLSEKVTVWTAGKEGSIENGAVDRLGIEQTVQTSAKQQQQANQTVNQQQDVQQENEQQLQTQQYNQLSKLGADHSLQEPWPWPEVGDPTSLDWLKFSSPEKKSVSDHEKVVPFFKVKEIVAFAKDKTLAAKKDAFDERLWMNNNFLKRWSRDFFPQAAEPGCLGQKDLFQVLVHAKKDANGSLSIVSLGPLMIHEASMWRRKLKDISDWETRPLKVFLWDVQSRTVQAGYNPPLEPIRNHADFSVLLCQLKFLNGTKTYTHDRSSMLEWVKTHQADQMEIIFRSIFKYRGTGNLYGSDIHSIFLAANDILLEDII